MNSNMYFSANTVQNVDLKRQEHKYESETGKEQKQRIGRARQEHMQAWICDKKGTETQKCKHQVRRQARMEHGIASMISKENQNKNIENFSKKGTTFYSNYVLSLNRIECTVLHVKHLLDKL